MIKDLLENEEFLKSIIICLAVIVIAVSAVEYASTPQVVNIDNSTKVDNYITNNTTLVQPQETVGVDFKTRGQCVMVENPNDDTALMRCALLE